MDTSARSSLTTNRLFRTPDVSIVMPVFNAAQHLGPAIESVFAQQTSATWELLIIDDGSTDGSLAIAERYARQHPQLRLLHHRDRGNHGSSASRNLGLAEAKAPVLAFLDADDIWLPHMLGAQLALLQAHPRAAMVYAQAERTWDMALPCLEHPGRCGANELPHLLPSHARPGLLASPQPLDWFFADEELVPCTCTVLVYTAVAREVGGFVESFAGLYDDQAFYAKLLLRYPAAVSTRCVARYRKHAQSCCAQALLSNAAQTAARRKFEAWLESYRTLVPVPQQPKQAKQPREVYVPAMANAR